MISFIKVAFVNVYASCVGNVKESKQYLNNFPADKFVLKDGKETKQERAAHTSK